MTFSHGIGEETARPVVWLFQGIVEHKGDEYRFWFEQDGRDGEINYEFTDDEPPESFDYTEFLRYCEEQVRKSQKVAFK